MRYLINAGILLAIFTLFSCKNKNKEQMGNKEKPAISVDVLIAAESYFTSGIEVNGTVLSDEMIELRPEASGRLIYLNIPDGAIVDKGTVLAKINDADLQAQLQQQKVQLELAVKNEERLRKLLTVNGVDQATYDAALSQVNLYNANINIINAQIDKTIVKAPFTGRLGLRLVSEGSYVSTTTVLGTLQQTDKIKIDFYVPETYENLVKTGKNILIRSNSSDDIYNATISAIEPQINTATRNIKVRARLNNGKINPGAFVKVWFNEKLKGIVVPTNAIIPDALASQVVVIKDGKAKFINIETGNRTSETVEVTEGLHIGDSVVVSGMLNVRPNANVKVKTVRSLPEPGKSE